VRHLVPVDRNAGAAEVGAAGQTQAASVGQLAEAILPVGDLLHTSQTFGQSDGRDAHVVGRGRVRLLDDLQPQVQRVDGELLRDLVQLYFLSEARLDRAVTPFGTAGRLVGESAAALEAVTRYAVGHGLQRARVEQAGHAVGAIGPAVEQRLQVHSGQRAVFHDAGAETHQHRVPAPVRIKYLFTGERDLDRTTQFERGLTDHDLVVEDVALATESAPVGTGDDPDMGGRKLQDLGQRAVYVVRCLRARPESQLAVGVERRQGSVLLDRQMGVAFKEEGVIEDLVGLLQRFLDVAEREGDALVDVAFLAVLVDPWAGVPQGFFGRSDGPQRFVVDFDQFQGFLCDPLVPGDHRGDRVADVAHAFAAERFLVLADRQDPELDR